MALPNPVIVVPGVTATDLRDLYDMPPKSVWGILGKEFDRVQLHPEDTRYEARLPAQVRPDQPFRLAYEEMVKDLRHNLSKKADKPTPVYLFGYDWREPLERTQGHLAAFIEEVINKTCLTRHYVADGYRDRKQVNLVGHSMGGLAIAGYLADAARAKGKVGKVATLATPFGGSLNAVQKLITGTDSEREREAARLTPSLYYLLPSFKKGITIDPAVGATTLFDPAAWQHGLVASIRESLRLKGSGAVPATNAEAERILGRLLGDAKAHRRSVETLDLAAAGLKPSDWLCVIGYGQETRGQLKITMESGGPRFDLKQTDTTLTDGDGTVPIAGSKPPFDGVAPMRVSPKDFEFLEIQDKGLTALSGLHGMIPNMRVVQNALRDHLK